MRACSATFRPRLQRVKSDKLVLGTSNGQMRVLVVRGRVLGLSRLTSIKSHLYSDLCAGKRATEALGGQPKASVPDWTLDAADGARRNRDVHATAPRTRLLAHTKAWMGMNSSFCCTLVSCTLLGGSTVDPSKQGSDQTHGFRAVPLYACRAVPLGGCE